ncbi:MAG: 3-phosphoshikimate 1-carboxyvinyltransferase [Actinomycetota bacterium]|nr:3-phosphoshikimate 1-carboxyvinyltransferase [Actinomycetota bacterium]
MSGPRAVRPLACPVAGTVRVPGSKSATARVLVAAALADGTSVIDGALFSDDTLRMTDSLRRLGIAVDEDGTAQRMTVHGSGGRMAGAPTTLNVGLAGTVARFLTPVAALGPEPVVIDGTPRMRERPMADLVAALTALGARIEPLGLPGHLPLRVSGPLVGGAVALPGNTSSQFLSGLLLAAPAMPDGLDVTITTPLVSRPYVTMTVDTMAAFGVEVSSGSGDRFAVAPGQRYRPRQMAIEPDASAASYFFAAAAVTGSRLCVAGVHRSSSQGDVGFVDLLAAMGASVADRPDGLEVTGPDRLRGIQTSMTDLSDVAQTLAVVAPFASSPTRIDGIGFVRGKETDRIGVTIRELRRCGVDADETDDGMVVRPSEPHGATIDTAGDHRMAMSFGVLGLRVPGIVIDDPDVTAKTFPAYFDTLDALAELGPLTSG